MKYYTMEADIHGRYVNFHKRYATRDKALDALFSYLADSAIRAQVEEEYPLSDKHDIQYVLSDNGHFRIQRHLA